MICFFCRKLRQIASKPAALFESIRLKLTRALYPHSFFAYPDPAVFFLNADLDPAVFLNEDPDQAVF